MWLRGSFAWSSIAWPRGEKLKLMGLWTRMYCLDGLSAVSRAIMTKVLSTSVEADEARPLDVRRDVRDKSIHVYYSVLALLIFIFDSRVDTDHSQTCV